MSGLALLPSLARRSYDGPVPVPPTARSVEAGLSGFVARWAAAGPVLALTRFAPFICDKVFNCRVADQARSYVLRLGTAGGAVSPGADPYRHADVVMPEHDWLGLLYGDYTGLAPLVAGELFPGRDQSNKVVLLGIVMYVFAFLPAGKDPDPQLFLRILEGVVQRGGLPACAGEPSVTEELDRFNSDPRGYVVQTVAPGAAVPPVTRLLAQFVAGLRYEQLPAGAVASAKAQLKGILGSIWAGGRMPPGRKFAGAVKAFGDRPEATVIGANSFRSSARHAALVNSVYAQILEWEDWTFLAHSGASIVPAALASGELAGASGKQLLTAIVAGNEILARSGEVLTDVIHTGNAVPTHQLETPLVAGKMLGLDGPSLQDALGIACTQPQVTAIPAWTSEAKGLLSGWPVLTGVEAALYARAGISGRRDIVESPGGYCYRVSDIPSPERMAQLVDGLGSVWRFDSRRHELVIKRFPTDGFQLTSVQAILQIVNDSAPSTPPTDFTYPGSDTPGDGRLGDDVLQGRARDLRADSPRARLDVYRAAVRRPVPAGCGAGQPPVDVARVRDRRDLRSGGPGADRQDRARPRSEPRGVRRRRASRAGRWARVRVRAGLHRRVPRRGEALHRS